MNEYMNVDAFISFSFRDEEKALDVVNRLQTKYHISCWICSREIFGGGRYPFIIPDAIKNAHVVVVLQSEAAFNSLEMPKEVQIALREKKTVIPFSLDNAQPHGALYYHLCDLNTIDGTEPEFEDRIRELAMAIKRNCPVVPEKAEETQETENILKSNMPKPKEGFVGRREVLDEINRRFSDGENYLFICGMGGIGKSQLVMQYAKEYAAEFDVQVFASYAGSLVETIANDRDVSISGMERGESPAEVYYSRRKMPKLEKLVNDRTLLVIDNFDVEWDEKLEDVLALPCKILITTRTDFADTFSGIRLNVMEEQNELRDVFANNYKPKKLRDEQLHQVDALIDYLGRHTMAIAIVARQCVSSRLSPAEMLEGLKTSNLHGMMRDRISFDLKKPQTGYEIFRTLFSVEKLTEEEKKILCDLALVPNKGIDTRLFHDWCRLETYDDINSLVQRNWILLNEEEDVISLHPLVAEVVVGEMMNEFPSESRLLTEAINYQRKISTWACESQMSEMRAEIVQRSLIYFPQVDNENEDMCFQCAINISYAAGMRSLVKELLWKIRNCRKEKYDKYHIANLEVFFHLIYFCDTEDEWNEMKNEVNDILEYLEKQEYYLLAMQYCIALWEKWVIFKNNAFFYYAEKAEKLSKLLNVDKMENLRMVRGIFGYVKEYLLGSVNHALAGYYLAKQDLENAYAAEKEAERILSDSAVYALIGIQNTEQLMEMNMQSVREKLGRIYMALGDYSNAEKCYMFMENTLIKYRKDTHIIWCEKFMEMIRLYSRLGRKEKVLEYRIKLRRVMEANYVLDDLVYKNVNQEFHLDEIVLED
ncbi:MAG: TIR domain-containing protein [Clostridia bacterium]|nr:TIR domain-containing protein [Clostridia bacterium]